MAPNIQDWTNIYVEELFHAAEDRETFKNVVANLRWRLHGKKKNTIPSVSIVVGSNK